MGCLTSLPASRRQKQRHCELRRLTQPAEWSRLPPKCLQLPFMFLHLQHGQILLPISQVRTLQLLLPSDAELTMLSVAAADLPPAPACVGGMSVVDTFTFNNASWVACEDLQHPGGSVALISSDETATT